MTGRGLVEEVAKGVLPGAPPPQNFVGKCHPIFFRTLRASKKVTKRQNGEGDRSKEGKLTILLLFPNFWPS